MCLLFLVNDNPDRKNDANDDTDNLQQKTIRLGLRSNINQFLILVLVNAFVGAMVGFGLANWFTCTIYFIVCYKLELDYICKCIAGNKSRSCLVNDSKYEGRLG